MFELSFFNLALALLTVFCAAVIRGLSGFGFSMFVVIILSMFAPPSCIVPMILLWEIAASIGHLPFVWKDVDWRALRPLAIGTLIGTPFGMWALAHLNPVPMVFIINISCLLCTSALLAGYSMKSMPSVNAMRATGLLSGVLNGAFANGGLPLILFFLSSPAAAATGRASLIAFFLFSDIWTSVFALHEGLMTFDTLIFALCCLPALFLGLWVGDKLYVKLDEARFKRLCTLLLLLITIVGLIKACIGLFAKA